MSRSQRRCGRELAGAPHHPVQDAPPKAAAAVLLALLALVTRLSLTALPAGAVGGTYSVNSIADNGDIQAGGGTPDGICRTSGNVCTLRAALFESERDAGPSTNNFAITGDGPHNAGPTTDPDGDAISSWTWAFGDGGSGTGTTPSHTYAAPGTYRVTLTVEDAQGGTGSTTASLFVSSDTRLARDGFSRTVGPGWGSAESGGAWTGTGGNGGLSVSCGTGRASVAVNSSKEVVLGAVSTSQTEASITVTANRAPLAGDHVAAIVARRQDATLAYRGRLRIAPGGAVFAGVEAGGTLLGEAQVAGLTAPAGTALRLRVRVTGTNPTTIEVKVWRADQAEPTSWSFTTTDSTAGLQQPGTVGMRVSSTETVGSNVQFSVDDVDVLAPPPPSSK